MFHPFHFVTDARQPSDVEDRYKVWAWLPSSWDSGPISHSALVLSILAFAVGALWLWPESSNLKIPAEVAVYLCIGLLILISFQLGKKRIAKYFTSDSQSETAVPVPAPWWGRYQPAIAAVSYTITIGFIAICLPIPQTGAVFGAFISVAGLAHPITSGIVALVQLFQVPNPWWYLSLPLCIEFSYWTGMVRAYQKMQAPAANQTGWTIFVVCALIGATAIVDRGISIRKQILLGNAHYERVTGSYQPFTPDNKLVAVDSPGISFAPGTPHLDGATALLPVYAAAAQAIYDPFDAVRVECNKTPNAYDRLIAGETDIIFVAQPSELQLRQAEEAGVKLNLHLIGKEAFVFLVHKDNPVESLTAGQIRGIYTKSIVDWSEVGGKSGKILAFQRPEGSGSQTALQKLVMLGQKPAAPLQEEVAEGMGGILRQVATYRNSKSSIGYSFRFFATGMDPIPKTKLLAINGIAPNHDEIRSDHYPYTAGIHAITAGKRSAQKKRFIDWFSTPAGRKLIEETGYVAPALPE